MASKASISGIGIIVIICSSSNCDNSGLEMGLKQKSGSSNKAPMRRRNKEKLNYKMKISNKAIFLIVEIRGNRELIICISCNILSTLAEQVLKQSYSTMSSLKANWLYDIQLEPTIWLGQQSTDCFFFVVPCIYYSKQELQESFIFYNISIFYHANLTQQELPWICVNYINLY